MNPTPRFTIRAAALLLAALTGAAAWAGGVDIDSLPLPPPPPMPAAIAAVPAVVSSAPAADAAEPGSATPAINVALLNAPAPAGGAPEVLFTDNATARDAIPAVPLVEFNKSLAAAAARTATRQTTALAIPATAPGNVVQLLTALGREAPQSATLESMLFEQLRAAMPQGGEGCIFEKVMLPSSANLPAQGWKVRYDFHLPARGIGPATFTANILGQGERSLRAFSGSVTIDREAKGIQASHLIHAGETLRPGDFQVMDAHLSALPRGALDQPEALAGTVARAELRPGQWLTDQMVKIPEIIKQSQPVTMIVAHGPIRITAPGIARQSGALGELIRVENMQSQRIIYAKIMNRDEVQVVF